MIQKMSDQGKISFLDKKNYEIKETVKEEKTDKTIEQLSEEQKAKKMSSKDDGRKTSHHILSAISGVVKDDGGPSKYIKSETSNSLWDNNKLERLSSELSNKEKTIAKKKEKYEEKKSIRQKKNDELIEMLKQTEQSKDTNVSRLGNFDGSKYYSPKNNLSIFDNSEFERLPEKTAGEKVSEDNKEKKEIKDESWKSDGRGISTKDAVDRIFNSLFKEKQNDF